MTFLEVSKICSIFVILLLLILLVVAYRKFRSKKCIVTEYTKSYMVRCFKVEYKQLTRNVNESVYSDGTVYGDSNVRRKIEVKIPYFEYYLNGKKFTFVKSHKENQPLVNVNDEVLLFTRNTDKIQCKDFYTEAELNQFKKTMKFQKGLMLVYVILTIVLVLFGTLA